MEDFDLNRDACYAAIKTRDRRFDGHFYIGVVSTGVYCRPICPARTPKLENCVFLPSAAAAHQMGFRPCLRCRPEVAPGLAGWRGSINTVSRALHLIAEGALDETGVEDLASRVGVGDRHLRRLFDQHVGASPVSVAQTHRILFAKRLITETSLPMAQIALAAGFGSIRRFNDVFQRTYGRPPRALRRASGGDVDRSGAITLKLPFSPPYDWDGILRFLAGRAIPDVEMVEEESYRRSFAFHNAQGAVEVTQATGESFLRATIRTTDVRVLPTVVARLRRLFDLDADITAIDSHLSQDPRLAKLVRIRPGARVPGAWDDFELAVRALLGQQISVPAARTLAGRIAAGFGLPYTAAIVNGHRLPNLVFPSPEAVAGADLAAIGLTTARSRALQALSAAMAADPYLLRTCETLDETVAKLQALPGVGPWTAQYIAMRALREPDAFPASDLGLLRAMENGAGRPTPKELLQAAEPWRPWRAYAAVRLWIQADGAPSAKRPAKAQAHHA